MQANPMVGKDQPPDLAALVPSGSIVLSDEQEKQPSSQVPIDGNRVDDKLKAGSGKIFIKCDIHCSFMYHPYAWKHHRFFGNCSTCFYSPPPPNHQKQKKCFSAFLLGCYTQR